MHGRHLDIVFTQRPEYGIDLRPDEHEVAGGCRLASPVGWKLMAIPEPIDGGIVIPPSVIVSARGTVNW